MNVFLVPARAQNARVSLARPIQRTDVQTALKNEQKYDALLRQVGEWKNIYCWAARSSRASTFERMQEGDLVLFSVAGTNEFNFMGTIAAKLESRSFARAFWSDPALKDWTLVYFLRNVEPLSVGKRELLRLLGYSPADRLQTSRVVPVARLQRFPSIDAFIQEVKATAKDGPTALEQAGKV